MNTQLLVITLLLVITALGSAHKKPAFGVRIINGFPIDITEVPFQVEIRRKNGGLCAGSILSKNYIITAAHCVVYAPHVDRFTIFSASNVRDKGMKSKVLEKYVHPKYNKTSTDYDVAILKVEPLTLSKENNTLPVALPPSGKIWPISTLVSVTGWGLTERNTSSRTLLQAILRIQDNSLCAPLFPKPVTERMLCVSHPDSKQSSCRGDSGGPMVLLNSNTLVGIVSWGESLCGRLGSTMPSIYTNVANPEIRQFIKDNTGL